MAANEVKLTIRVGDDGTLDVVAKKSKQAAKETENLGKATTKTEKSRNRFHKGEKGVAGATANGTKAFSKMRQSMTGSSGLVSAYAILASNIFAATAAFNALRRAAQIQQLEQGLRLVGAAAGANLPDIANSLRDITDNAISSEQSMRATALAVSSGFRSDQLQDLTRVAKGASIALGRDMGDALDRLVRGTAKLEPEILDELGIMVRLDDAVSEYADRLGIAAGSLTQFDRRQAFLNATIEQGLKKFEDLSEGVDANAYDKLASALANLQKEVIKAVSNFTKLTTAVEFASRNLLSLTAVGTTLGLSITRGVAPGLFQLADASAASARGLLDNRVELAKATITTGKLPPKFQALVGSLAAGTASTKEFDTASASLTGKLGGLTKRLNNLKEGTDEYTSTSNEIAGVRQQLERLPQLQEAQANATRAQASANAIGAASSFRFGEVFKNLGVQFDEDTAKTKRNAEGKKGLRVALSKLGPAFKVGATGARAFGAALFTALPYIGLIISAGSILFNVIKEKFFPEDIVQKRIDDAKESFKQFAEIQDRFMKSQAEDGQRTVESYIALAGILDQISGKIREVVSQNVSDLITQGVADQNRIVDINAEIEQQRKLVKSLNDPINRYRGSNAEIARINRNINDLIEEKNTLERKGLNIGKDRSDLEIRSAKEVLKGALLQLRVNRQIAENQKESVFNLNIMEGTYKDLEGLQDKLNNNTITFEEFLVELEKIQRYPASIRAAFQEVDESVSSFNSVITKRQLKTKALFQEEEEAAQKVLNQFETLTKKVTDPIPLVLKFEEQERLRKEADDAKKLLAELRERVKGLKIGEEFTKDEAGLKKFIEFIEKTRTNINKLSNTIAQQKVELKGVGTAIKGITGGQTLFLETQNDLLKNQVQLVNDRIKAARVLDTRSDAEFEKSDKYNDLLEERTGLETQIVDQTIINARKAVDLIRLEEKRNNLAKARLKTSHEAFALQKRLTSLGAKLSPADEFKLSVRLAKIEVDSAKLDLKLTMQKAKLQRELLILEMTANKVSKEKQTEVLKLLNDQLAVTEAISRERVASANFGVTSAIGAGIPESDFGVQAMANAASNDPFVASLASRTEQFLQYSKAVTVAANAEENYNNALTAKDDAGMELFYAQLREVLGTGTAEATDDAQAALDSAKENVSTSEAAMLASQRAVKQAALSMAVDTLTSMSAVLAEFGPEGKLAASLGQMSAIMITSVVSAMEMMEVAGDSTASKLAAGFSAAAAIIGGIGSVLKEQSNVAIAAVDKQIEAEKKRDGKSAQSLAKIKKLEKQKETMKRKQFETDKKIQIASAIMSTAAGIAGALAQADTLGAFAIPLAVLIGAMGAAQVAIISGMSYQGGGSAPSTPSSVSVGQRRESVDIAKSQGGAGELAYFRGGRGQGGPEDFRPAFMGYKNRAEGGATGLVVGEQGPELFVPETPGRIIPADDVRAPTPINANINISAIDAEGVEDVLINQRGNIISMIREAANAQGNTFLEEVNVAEL